MPLSFTRWSASLTSKMLLFLACLLFHAHAVIQAPLAEIISSSNTSQNRLVRDILESYDKKVKPTRIAKQPVVVVFSMELYQLIEVNEPQQYININAWIVERWRDELLHWDPAQYEDIKEIMLPHNVIWMPDTTLYNTLIMNPQIARHLMNAKLKTNTTDKSVHIELLYPTIYKFSCTLNIYYFPFDSQYCTMTFGSWTYDNSGIDYLPISENVGTSNFLGNDLWSVEGFTALRRELKYPCCPNNYTNLYYTLHLKRKPRYYIANIIVPTCIITLISIVGFFSPSSANGEREEKISLGITTLLSLAILLLMISDHLPTTSTFVPLIGWFFLSMILLISMSTIFSSIIIMVQKMGRHHDQLSPRIIRIFSWLSRLSFTHIPRHLDKEKLVKDRGARLNSEPGRETALNHSESVASLQLIPLINMNNEAPKSVENDGNNINSLKLMKKQPKTAAAAIDERNARILIEHEYDWVATVMERCAFLFFFILFLLLSLGINGIGLAHYMSVDHKS